MSVEWEVVRGSEAAGRYGAKQFSTKSYFILFTKLGSLFIVLYTKNGQMLLVYVLIQSFINFLSEERVYQAS